MPRLIFSSINVSVSPVCLFLIPLFPVLKSMSFPGTSHTFPPYEFFKYPLCPYLLPSPAGCLHQRRPNSAINTSKTTFENCAVSYVHGCSVTKINGRFLSGGIILGSPLSCSDLFLYTVTLPAVSRDAPATLSYTTLEMASRVLLSSKKPALMRITVRTNKFLVTI